MRKLGFLNNLLHIRRYSGLHLQVPESDSDHVWEMNTLALEFVPLMNQQFGTEYNIKSIIYGISIHDIDESLYCDIPRTFKHYNEKIESAIKETVNEIMSAHFPKSLVEDINYYTDTKNVHGFLIKVFDIAQSGYKMLSEIKLGNSIFKNEICNVFDCLHGKLESIKQNEGFNITYKNALIWLIEFFIKDIQTQLES